MAIRGQPLLIPVDINSVADNPASALPDLRMSDVLNQLSVIRRNDLVCLALHRLVGIQHATALRISALLTGGVWFLIGQMRGGNVSARVELARRLIQLDVIRQCGTRVISD